MESGLKELLCIQGQGTPADRLNDWLKSRELIFSYVGSITFKNPNAKTKLLKELNKMKSYVQQFNNLKIEDYVENEKMIGGKKRKGEEFINEDEAQKIIDAVKNKVQQSQLNQQNLDNPLIIENNFS